MNSSNTLYDDVLGIVERNTGDPQSTTVEKDQLLLELPHVDVEEAEQVLRAALENGDLERRGRGYCLPAGRD